MKRIAGKLKQMLSVTLAAAMLITLLPQTSMKVFAEESAIEEEEVQEQPEQKENSGEIEEETTETEEDEEETTGAEETGEDNEKDEADGDDEQNPEEEKNNTEDDNQQTDPEVDSEEDTENQDAEPEEETQEPVDQLVDEGLCTSSDGETAVQLITEPVYYQVDGETYVFFRLDNYEFSWSFNGNVWIDNSLGSASGMQGDMYYCTSSKLEAGKTHTLKVQVGSETLQAEFQVEEDPGITLEEKVQESATAWSISVCFSYYASEEKKISRVDMVSEDDTVYATATQKSGWGSNGEDDRYTILGGENGLSAPYTHYYNQRYPLQTTRMITPAGTYDLNIVYEDDSVECLEDAVEIVGAGDEAYISKVYNYNYHYDTETGKYLYIMVYGNHVDFSKLCFKAVYTSEDGSNTAEYGLSYITHEETDEAGHYIVKLRKDNWPSLTNGTITGEITAAGGYDIEIKNGTWSWEAGTDERPAISYINWKSTDKVMEVAVINTKTTSMEVNLYTDSDFQVLYASGSSKKVNQGYAEVSMYLADGSQAQKIENQIYYIEVILSDGTILKEWSQYITGVSDYTAGDVQWIAHSQKIAFGAEGITYAADTKFSIKDKSSVKVKLFDQERQQELLELKNVKLEAYLPPNETDAKIRISFDSKEFSNYGTGDYYLVVEVSGKVRSYASYAYVTILETDKFLLSGVNTPAWQDEDTMILNISGLPDPEDAGLLSVEMWDPYGNKVDNIKLELLNTWNSQWTNGSIYAIKGIKRSEAYRKYWIKVTHNTKGEPYSLYNQDQKFYSDEKGRLDEISTNGYISVRQYDNRAVGISSPVLQYPVTISAFMMPDDGTADAFMTAYQPDGSDYNGYYINFTPAFIKQLPDKNRSYKLMVKDASGVSREISGGYVLGAYGTAGGSETPDVSYTIRYQLNGGQNAAGNPVQYKTGDDLTFQDPSRTGYEFKGWYTDKGLTKEFSYDKSSTKGNLVLYAKWEVIKYQLTYDLDGGALAKGKTNPTVYDAVKDVTLNAPVKAGYNFTGWKVNEEETRITNNKITKGSHTGDLHLTACWKEYAYRVVWNKNAKDAAGSMSAVDLTFSEELTIPEEGYTRNGYDFLGWNTSANGKGTAYTEGMKVKGLSTKDKATVTLYAQWQERPFEILYELNGGVNNAKNPDSYSLNKTVSLQNPTREGFTFAGWYTDAGFADGTQIRKIEKNPGDITVYARWRENVYTIKLDGNGGKRADKKVMSPVNATFTEEKVLPSNEYVRAGYRFEGWNTRKDGKGTAYADGETVSGLLAKDKAAVTLYAQWTIIEIPITYELDGGVNSAKNPAVVTIAKDVSLSAPTREGYTFKGWYTDSSCEVKLKNNKILKSTTQPVTVYAKWEENRYALKYDKNGGKYEISKEAQNKSYGYTDSVTLLNGKGAERANYALTGWNTKKDRSGTHYDLGAACSGLAQKGTVILYAEWTPLPDKTHRITYHNLEGAENRNPDSYSFEKDVKLANPVRTGYTFNGWYTDAAYESKKVASVSRKETKDMELYAKWTENQYTIKYDGNKGSCPKGVKMVPVQTSYTHAVTLTDNAFIRKGYEFTGWNTKKDGTGVPYEDKDSVTGLSDKNKGTVTLYAQWQAVSYKVTYENMGEAADNSMNPDSYTVEKDVTLKTPEWYGYTFKGWYSDSECKKKVTKISRNTAQPVTVYAKWEENEYSVRFALQGGEGNIKSLVNRKYTAEITIPDVEPEKEGKTFAGWSLSPNGSVQYQAGEKVSFRQIHEDGGTAKGKVKKYVTLYAIWQ